MLHDTFAYLSRVAERCPVLILLATEDVCRGILIRQPASKPLLIEFPALQLRRLRQLRGLLDNANIHKRSQIENRAIKSVLPRGTGLGANEVLAELWNKVMKMVVEALGISVCTSY